MSTRHLNSAGLSSRYRNSGLVSNDNRPSALSTVLHPRVSVRTESVPADTWSGELVVHRKPTQKQARPIPVPYIFRAAFRRISAWNAQRKAILHLQSLDDRLLRDIGIERGEIEYRVRSGRDAR